MSVSPPQNNSVVYIYVHGCFEDQIIRCVFHTFLEIVVTDVRCSLPYRQTGCKSIKMKVQNLCRTGDFTCCMVCACVNVASTSASLRQDGGKLADASGVELREHLHASVRSRPSLATIGWTVRCCPVCQRVGRFQARSSEVIFKIKLVFFLDTLIL